MIRYTYACLLLIVFGWSSSLHASDLTVFVGYQNPGRITLRSGGQAALDALTNPRNFGVVGVRVGHGPQLIGFEHTLAKSVNFIDSNSTAVIYNSNLIVNAPLLIAKPYGTVGAGIVRATGDGPGAFGTKFAINYGGGLKFSLIGPVGGRFDVRGYSISKVQSQRLNVFEMSVGIVFSY